ncbi:hypothetical protein EW145_g6898 [Phellinidium pouzarii]|uniref:PIG-P domain-containing protein n=1 Tax=Phellinidium pouzarii TaxID=167371 RepID=A0A4S4KS73_9AGAM|nr:hypothetical protein EW145_g6898 [Phellinidium pouzarii]
MDQYQSNEPTSPRSPLAPYPYPASSTQLRSRAPEFYGFVAWTSTYALFVLYVLWALFPDEWITRLGIEWYPSREWAILLPAYSVILILLTYFTYWALALYGTPSLGDMCTIIGGVPLPSLLRVASFLAQAYAKTYSLHLHAVLASLSSLSDTHVHMLAPARARDTSTSTDTDAATSTSTDIDASTDMKTTLDVYLAAASPSGSGIYDVPITFVSRVLYDRAAGGRKGRSSRL